jgi:hypothetical protein
MTFKIQKISIILLFIFYILPAILLYSDTMLLDLPHHGIKFKKCTYLRLINWQ